MQIHLYRKWLYWHTKRIMHLDKLNSLKKSDYLSPLVYLLGLHYDPRKQGGENWDST